MRKIIICKVTNPKANMKTTKNFLLNLLLSTLFFSCNNQNKKNTNKNEITNNTEVKNENTDIKLLKEYLAKENKSLTDKDGFTLNYKIDRLVGKIRKLASSDTLTNSGTYMNSLFLNLSVQECIFSLSLNGIHKKNVHLVAQVFSLNQLNPSMSDNIPSKYKTYVNYFFPELDNDSLQKEIIKDVTTPRFYQEMGKQNENDIMLSNKWINITTELIKSSNILNKKTILDIEK